MAEEVKLDPEPFQTLLNVTFPPTMESMRLGCLGTYVSAGGGGVLMMYKDWERQNPRELTSDQKKAFMQSVSKAVAYLNTLRVDVDIMDAYYIKMLCPNVRIYWIPTKEEIILN